MSLSRATLSRIKTQIAKVRASRPPFVAVIEPQGERESAAAFRARSQAALRPGEGRRRFLVIVDRIDSEHAAGTAEAGGMSGDRAGRAGAPRSAGSATLGARVANPQAATRRNHV